MISQYELAYELAYKLHDPVVFAHVKRVAERVEAGPISHGSDEEIVVALLHDILEDTVMTEVILRRLFPKRVVDAVVVLTRNQLTEPAFPGEVSDGSKPMSTISIG